MEEIEIKQLTRGVGFAVKPVETSLQGVVFDNGKIAYLNSSEDVCGAYDEKSLVKSLKAENSCIEVQVIRKYKV